MRKKHQLVKYPLLEEFEKLDKLSKARKERVKSYKFRKLFECTKCTASFVSSESLTCHVKRHGTPAPPPIPRFALLSPNPNPDPPEEEETPSAIPPHLTSTVRLTDLEPMSTNFYQAPYSEL